MSDKIKMLVVVIWVATQMALSITPAHANMHGGNHITNNMTQSSEQDGEMRIHMKKHTIEGHSVNSDNLIEQDECCESFCQTVSVFSEILNEFSAPDCVVEAQTLPSLIDWQSESSTPPPNTLL